MKSLLYKSVAAALLAFNLSADTLPGLFNTGVDDSGAILDNAAVDPHYTLTSSTDTNASGPDLFTLNPGFPVGPWIEEGPTSRWIAPQADQGTGNNPGDYTFSTSVDLTGFDETTTSIEGLWSSDNGVKLILNGVDTGLTQAGFGGFGTFTVTSGFVPGLNHLDFLVNNAPPGVNPIGFRAEMVGNATALPAGTPLTITTQPSSNVNVRVTGTTTLRVVAHGSAPLNYQWYKGAELVTGATNAELRLSNVTTNDAGTYTVRMTNSVNSITSTSANVVVQPAFEVIAFRFAQITLEGSTGRPHLVEFIDIIPATGTPAWQTLSNLTLAPNPKVILDTSSSGAAVRFYRARRLLTP